MVRRGKPEKARCFRDSGAPEPPNRYACTERPCAPLSALSVPGRYFSGCAGRRAERRRRRLWRAQRTKAGCTGHTPRSRLSVGFYGILAAAFRRIGLGGFSRFALGSFCALQCVQHCSAPFPWLLGQSVQSPKKRRTSHASCFPAHAGATVISAGNFSRCPAGYPRKMHRRRSAPRFCRRSPHPVGRAPQGWFRWREWWPCCGKSARR